jgi:hypothetical protein
VFLNKAARKAKLKEVTRARLAAKATAKKAFAERMKHAWFKADNTSSCKVRASILGYDK